MFLNNCRRRRLWLLGSDMFVSFDYFFTEIFGKVGIILLVSGMILMSREVRSSLSTDVSNRWLHLHSCAWCSQTI